MWEPDRGGVGASDACARGSEGSSAIFGLREAGVAFASSATPCTRVAKAKGDGGVVGIYIDYKALHEVITWLATCIHEMMTCSGAPSVSAVSHLVLWLAELKARTRGLPRLCTSRYA